MPELVVRNLGLQPYSPIFEAMQAYTNQRDTDSNDELWVLEHEPVYTQGRAGSADYILRPGNIPIIPIDRGGQVTYHGPGQLTIYTLLDIKRLGIGVRELVTLIEESIVACLADMGVDSAPRADAPGVYVGGAKIAALGLRIRQGRSYHGLNFNIDMDMKPWSGINACGLGVPVTQLKDQLFEKQGVEAEVPMIEKVAENLVTELSARLGYNTYRKEDALP